MAKTPKPEEQNVLHVALARDCDSFFNAVVLSASDFVVPLEIGKKGDRGLGDAVRIRALDGSFERVLALPAKGSKDVERPQGAGVARLWLRGVRFGAYRMGLRVAGRWYDTLGNLVFRKGGAFVGDDAVPEQKPALSVAPVPRIPPLPAACFDLGACYDKVPPGMPDQCDYGD